MSSIVPPYPFAGQARARPRGVRGRRLGGSRARSGRNFEWPKADVAFAFWTKEAGRSAVIVARSRRRQTAGPSPGRSRVTAARSGRRSVPSLSQSNEETRCRMCRERGLLAHSPRLTPTQGTADTTKSARGMPTLIRETNVGPHYTQASCSPKSRNESSVCAPPPSGASHSAATTATGAACASRASADRADAKYAPSK